MVRRKILVTGGAGFIGSHLVNRLIDMGHQVTVLDNLRTGSTSNIHNKADFLEVDLHQQTDYLKIPSDIDKIFHLAAQVSNEASYVDPVLDINSNAFSTLSLLRWAKENKVSEFIFSSTMGVYSDNLGYPAREGSPIQPKGFYGIHKRAAEEYVRIFSEEGMKTNILRLFNVYGPGQNMSDLRQGMLSIYMSFIWKNEPIKVKGPLDRVRDFVYVDDVVDALVLSGFGRTFGEIYNVCTGRKTTVGEALDLIKSAFNVDNNYPIEILDRTSRDIDSTFGSYEKISKEYCWEPKVSLEKGVTLMVKWLKENTPTHLSA